MLAASEGATIKRRRLLSFVTMTTCNHPSIIAPVPRARIVIEEVSGHADIVESDNSRASALTLAFVSSSLRCR
jgi:hypothetical protein